jgi:hypothetical protein
MADMAAAWTVCTKKLFAEKSATPGRGDLSRGFAVFAGFFEGGFGKSGRKRVVFCGDFYGGSMVGMWFLDGAFSELKIFLSRENFSVEKVAGC